MKHQPATLISYRAEGAMQPPDLERQLGWVHTAGFGLALAGVGGALWLAVYIVVQAPLAALLGVWMGRRIQPAGWLRFLPAALLGLVGIGQLLSAFGAG